MQSNDRYDEEEGAELSDADVHFESEHDARCDGGRHENADSRRFSSEQQITCETHSNSEVNHSNNHAIVSKFEEIDPNLTHGSRRFSFGTGPIDVGDELSDRDVRHFGPDDTSP